MIQIATVGDAQIVVKEGLRKVPPKKLFILHTKNEKTKNEFNELIKNIKSKKQKDSLKTKQYEDNAEKLRKEIIKEFDIPVELIKVGKYETYAVIREIQNIISNEKKKNKKLQGQDVAINITGGTKAMVAGAVCSAYLAQTKMYYVLEYHEAQGKELVIELPVPPRVKSRNTISGSTEKTTSIILQKIWDLNPPIGRLKLLLSFQKEKFPSEKFDKNGKKKIVLKSITPQILNFHLNKLEDKKIIERRKGEEKTKYGKIDRRSTIIHLTDYGNLCAAYPETIVDVV